jgi:hypothetical protein
MLGQQGLSRIIDRVARWFTLNTINLNLGNFWKALDWKMLIYFMTIWDFTDIWDIFRQLRTFSVNFSSFGILIVDTISG